MKKISFYLLGIITSFFVAIILCEFLSRLFLGGIFRNDPVLLRNSLDGLTYKNNQSTKFISFEWDVEVEINDNGFRDINNIYQSKKDKVLILGDSFTEGFGVSLENSYPKKLEKLFHDSDIPFDVYNAGITGNNLVDYIEIYNRYFANDDTIKVVIIGLFPGNDLKNSYKIRNVTEIKKNNILNSLKQAAAKNSTFYNILNRFIKSNYEISSILVKFGIIKEKKNILVNYDLKNSLQKEKIFYSTNLLNKFKESIIKKKLLVILIPSKEQINDESWEFLIRKHRDKINDIDRKLPTELVEKKLNDYGINVINFYNIFNLYKRKTPIYFEYDPHINIQGHTIISSEIFKKLKIKKSKN